AFGGSFLNHQWLIAAATPVWANALNDGSSNDRHSVLDANGMPVTNNGQPSPALQYPLYKSPTPSILKDQQETQSCNPGPGRGPVAAGFLWGQLCDKPDTAGAPAVPARSGRGAAPPAAHNADHRRRTDRRRRRLGVVRRRLGQRERRHVGPRLDERPGSQLQ